jgi:hypothetical protein
VLSQYWDEEAGTYMVKIEWPESDAKQERPPTLREAMILAIVARCYRRRAMPTDIALVTRQIEAGWRDECERRKLEYFTPPKRDTVGRTLRRARLIS